MAARKKRTSLRLEDHFFCKNLKTAMKVEECLENYVNVNALGNKESYCYKCQQGQRLRSSFSRG